MAQKQSKGELAFEGHLHLYRIQAEQEHRFHPTRRWRFDFAFPEQKLAIEIEGGIWTGGRHTRGSGYQKDMEKYNAANLLGWKVLRFTTKEAMQGDAITQTIAALQELGHERALTMHKVSFA